MCISTYNIEFLRRETTALLKKFDEKKKRVFWIKIKYVF